MAVRLAATRSCSWVSQSASARRRNTGNNSGPITQVLVKTRLVVAKNWRFGPVIAIKTFEELYIAKMQNYMKNGVRFKRAFADVVSKGGEHLMIDYGLSFTKETTHNSRIFEGPFSRSFFHEK